MKLPNYVADHWREGSGPGAPLVDPVTGDELARISSEGVDLNNALEFARTQGGSALRQLTYAQRADLLAKMGDALTANRDEYFRLSLLNLGATQADASFDVDGALYTIKYYAKIGRALAEGKMLKEGAVVPLSKTGVFAGQHFLVPTKGVAVFISRLATRLKPHQQNSLFRFGCKQSSKFARISQTAGYHTTLVLSPYPRRND